MMNASEHEWKDLTLSDLIIYLEATWAEVGVPTDPDAQDYSDIEHIVAPEALRLCSQFDLETLVQLNLFMHGLMLMTEMLQHDDEGKPVSAEEGNEKGATFEVDALRVVTRAYDRLLPQLAMLIPANDRRSGISVDFLPTPKRDTSEWMWLAETLQNVADRSLTSGVELSEFNNDLQPGMPEALFQVLRACNFVRQEALKDPEIEDDYSASQLINSAFAEMVIYYYDHLPEAPRRITAGWLESVGE